MSDDPRRGLQNSTESTTGGSNSGASGNTAAQSVEFRGTPHAHTNHGHPTWTVVVPVKPAAVGK